MAAIKFVFYFETRELSFLLISINEFPFGWRVGGGFIGFR